MTSADQSEYIAATLADLISEMQYLHTEVLRVQQPTDETDGAQEPEMPDNLLSLPTMLQTTRIPRPVVGGHDGNYEHLWVCPPCGSKDYHGMHKGKIDARNTKYVFLAAAYQGCKICLEHFITNGINPNIRSDNQGFTALDWAKYGCNNRFEKAHEHPLVQYLQEIQGDD